MDSNHRDKHGINFSAAHLRVQVICDESDLRRVHGCSNARPALMGSRIGRVVALGPLARGRATDSNAEVKTISPVTNNDEYRSIVDRDRLRSHAQPFEPPANVVRRDGCARFRATARSPDTVR